MEELTDENCDLKMAKEKLEDELNEKKRAAEGIEFVSDINSLNLEPASKIVRCYFKKRCNDE